MFRFTGPNNTTIARFDLFKHMYQQQSTDREDHMVKSKSN